MLKCVDAMFGICGTAREHKHLHKVQPGLVIVAHVMNAVRVIAGELLRPETRSNARLFTNHCYAVELFLDSIEDITLLSPAWTDTPLLLRDSLATIANSLRSSNIVQ
ncbi:hypothetical protein DL93DRAFT_2233337 [Clavulina sp. PMI_390]|nr:hypothetical protein DL93DRAFT_2233337 [Clavulina sp. PMI_390]